MRNFLSTFLLRIHVVIFILSLSQVMGQEILVSGFVEDTISNNKNIKIAINDTIRKYIEANETPSKLGELRRNRSYFTEPDFETGYFRIKAKPSDSIHFYSYWHESQAYLVSDLIEHDLIKIFLKPRPCKEYVKCEDEKYELYSFIGEKISVNSVENTFYCNVISMDARFKATYKIVENLYGTYDEDTIRFDVYNHYGRPYFENLDRVILYVGDYCGELINVKYQFSPIYETVNNELMVPYYPVPGLDKIYDSLGIQIKKLDFLESSGNEYSDQSDKWLDSVFPSPYFKRKGKTIKPLYGISPIEKFKAMRATTLKGRGFFD